ncbi:MAG: hypothetical protein J2O47_02465 [Acidimicrobiaceae bacterium]|nr:hypothetical protein [Acidimicrobiaceae bacterium]
MTGSAPGTSIDSLALELIEEAGERDIKLRLTGSLAVRHHCHARASAMSDLGRRPPQDIDLAGYWKQHKAIASLFESRGFVLDPAIRQAQEYGVKRFVYEHQGIKVDVFMDELVMAHTLSYRDRLELSAPTLPVTDLLLSKLQVHEMTANDLIDMTILVLEHETADGPQPDVIRRDQVTEILRNDWGFWYEAMQNLDRLERAVSGYPSLTDEDRTVAQHTISDLRTVLVESPKSTRWKLRARVGERVRYWEEVDEVHRP